MVEPAQVEELLCDAFSRDLSLLAALSDEEPTPQLLESLREVPARDWFAFLAKSEISQGALALIAAALEDLPSPIDQKTYDDLGADYANIYLLHAYRAPPTESPWLDKDQLERQQPMFELAEWYEGHGLKVADRQLRSDDHFVLQLKFLSHMLAQTARPAHARLSEAARFLDAHLLRWFGQFAERIATRCATPYFCGVVTLTHGYLEDMRDELANRLDMPRAALGTSAELRAHREVAEPPPRYMPGVAPSW
ncbi:MAG: molecular chaperone TorD family protein [Hyphomicrobiaceae bacterium]|nr:molecular chaperone TorD family protein [Hyphomicrobiaceae bacterium]